MSGEGGGRPRGWIAAWVTDVARCLRFYARLPVPALPWETDPHGVPDFATTPRALPVAGALIGAFGAAMLVLALALGLGPVLAAGLAVATLTLVTGAFHEDGLADTADGFGGGAMPERRLEIMKDSRIGSFGGAALILGFVLRIAALATLADRVTVAAAAAGVIVVAALSRTAGLTMFALSPPARRSGASYAVGQPTPATVATAWALTVALALGLGLLAALPLAGLALAFGLAAGVAVFLTRLSVRLIGGHSGDVAGAIQQVSEIAALIGLLIAARP